MARSKRLGLPDDPVVARIVDADLQGYGTASVDEREVRIHGALAGELVSFRYTRMRRNAAEGALLEVLEASPDRQRVECAQFGRCGGCALQHQRRSAQLRDKQRRLLALFEHNARVKPARVLDPLFDKDAWRYRKKARLGVKYVAKKQRVLVGFRERGSGFVCDTEICPVLDPRVGECLTPLAEMIGKLSIRDRIPQIEVAIDDTDCLLIFRLLAEPTRQDLGRIGAFCNEYRLLPYTQTGGEATIRPLAGESRTLCYHLPDQALQFDFAPTDFTQVNAGLNRLMITQSLQLLDPTAADQVLDLFCGLGNFTLPIAQHAAWVVGVEGSDSLVDRARHNARLNSVENASFYSADLYGSLSNTDWLGQHYDKVLLDPPRSGALQLLPHLANSAANRIVYVSCNPETLARDADELINRFEFRLSAAGVMDMFPHTAHLESIALFER